MDVQIFRRVVGAVAGIVASTPDPDAETPCAAWNYAQLLGHLVGGDRMTERVITGEGGPRPARPRLVPPPDVPAPTPAEYQHQATRVAELFADPATMAGSHELPVGTLPGPAVVLLRSVEHLLHGWDLARSAGADASPLEQPAAALTGPALQLLAQVSATAPPERRAFAEAVPIDDTGSALDGFVAAFGRDPTWRPDADLGFTRLIEHFADDPEVEIPDGSRRGFGAMGLRIRNKVFACPHQGGLMLKLGDEARDLIAAGLGRPMAATDGSRPMRNWVVVPIDGSATARAERALQVLRAELDAG